MMEENYLKSFHKLTREEKIQKLVSLNLFDESLNTPTPASVFDHIIENYVTTYEIGLGIAPNFLVDGKVYHLPLATEEPSVIAAASNAAKIISQNGGFKTVSVSRLMSGQIIFKNVSDQASLVTYLEGNFERFKEVARLSHPRIYELGGGVHSFKAEIKPKGFVCLYVTIDTLEAMGANIINTILEGIAAFIGNDYKVDVLMSILTNLSLGSLVTTTVRIDPKTLKNSAVVGQDIELASLYATLDPFRAVTHNKGIMNGISALMLATGNDTRSIEAGAHAYASSTGTYLPLSTWEMVDGFLVGSITLPLALGTVGGSIGVLPKVKLAHKILNINNAQELMKVTAALGLAQNFAALYALTTDGINKGHMRLHARTVALESGANEKEIDKVVTHMLKEKSVSSETAISYLKKIRN